MRRALKVLRSGSPLVGIFGGIAVMVLLLLLAYEFRTASSGTPAPRSSVEAPPVPK
jgi:hypothetical protein